MRFLTAAAVVILLGGCATMQQPKPTVPKVVKAAPKHAEPCPCSPTANETVKKRWFSGWKIKFFH